MPQHFLLSAQARTLSLKAIYAAGEEGAYATFCKLRWHETDGEPVCPHCGGLDAYKITTRRRFKCSACGKQFSVTSGTIFASRKMSFVDLLAAICIVVNAAKGVSALQLARDLDCQAKTAFVLGHKIRESMASEMKAAKLFDEVEVDGAYFGGHIRPENRKEDRKDRRLSENQTGKRRVVVAMRQRKGRTLTAVFHSEDEAVPMIRTRVAAGSIVFADEASAWDALHGWYTAKRINHSIAFMDDGVCTNQASSRAFAGWLAASITRYQRNTCTNMPPMRRGWRIIDGLIMARSHTAPLGWRSLSLCRVSGRGTGNGRSINNPLLIDQTLKASANEISDRCGLIPIQLPRDTLIK